MAAYITIRYNEGNKTDLGYKSVDLHYNNTKKIFNSGNFIKDWFDLKKFITLELDVNYITYSSSVDHFIMDGAPYDQAYLHMIDEKPVLKYFDRSNLNWWIDSEKIGDGTELFVHDGTKPTWEELKELCK